MSAPMSSHIETLAGHDCLVEERPGHGRQVVFANGCGLPRGMWTPVVERLSRPALLFDRPGVSTPWPGHAADLEEEVTRLAELLRRRPGAVVVAHSMAAFHAEGVLLRHPGLVGALVLVDPSVEWRTRRTWPEPLRAASRWAQGAAGFLPIDVAVRSAAVLFTRAQTVSRLTPEVAALLSQTYGSSDAVAAATTEFMAYERQANDLLRWRDELPPLQQVPTTVLTAVPRQPTAAQRRYVKYLGARHVLVSHSRHLVMLDAPEAVLAAIAAPGGPMAGRSGARS